MTRFPYLSLLAPLALLGSLATAAPAPADKPVPPPGGPAFDVKAETPHRITFSIDTAPARDTLGVLAGGADAASTLKRLRGSPVAVRALSSGSLPPEDFFGRLASAAAGTPDPLLATWSSAATTYRSVLAGIEAEGGVAALVESRRVASLLPKEPAVAMKFRIVPFFGVSGFAEVTPVAEEGETLLVADLPRLVGDESSASPREILLKMLRTAASEAWRQLFDANFRKAPAFPAAPAALDAFLARTAVDGPATLFLFPDEFFPLASLLDEPISRSFFRWNRAVEALVDPKIDETKRQDILAESTRGEFWGRYAAIAGAQMTDAILRGAGREAYLAALAAGPRAVITLYLTVSKDGKLPQVTKPARKILEKPPAP